MKEASEVSEAMNEMIEAANEFDKEHARMDAIEQGTPKKRRDRVAELKAQGKIEGVDFIVQGKRIMWLIRPAPAPKYGPRTQMHKQKKGQEA